MEYDLDEITEASTSPVPVNNETSETTGESINKTPNIVTSEVADETASKTTNETSTSSRHTSAVWDHFSLLPNEPKAKCEYCNKLFSHKKGCGTSHLRRHLNACLKFQNLSNGQTKLKFNPQTKGPYTNDLARKDITDMIVWDELSFQFVEGQGFRKLINGLLPNFSISADTIKRDIMKAYDKRKSLIKEILQNAEGKISLTCDAWTSLQQLEYLSVTAHFINKDWNLVSILLLFPLIPYPHTGINIANCIKTEIDEWFITTKVIHIVALSDT